MFLRTKSWHLRAWLCGLALAIAGVTTAPASAQGPEAKAQLEAVFKDWQYRQSIFKSVRYVLTGTMEYQDKQLPPGNPIRPRRKVLLLDLEKKRFRMEGSQEDIFVNGKDNDPKAWEYRRYISTSAYDGKELQNLTHRKANRIENDREDDLLISKGTGHVGRYGNELWPIFFAHGIVATVHSPLSVDNLPLTPDPDDFDIAGRQLLQGQNCLLVRSEPVPGVGSLSDEFWIDTSRKSAIHRHVYFTGSDPCFHFEISWKNTAHGWWVDRWSQTWSPFKGVRRITRLCVESFEANPEIADSDFRLPVEPGMVVKVAGRNRLPALHKS